MSNPIKLGVVGLGRAGRGMHFSEIKEKTDKFQVAACCDIIRERVDQTIERFGCKGYDSIDDLIADPDVEIVDIATRTNDHFSHAVKALKAGKDVLLEKPVAMSYEETKELFSLANKPGKPILFVRQNRRFEKAFNNVLDLVNSGKLGTVFEINVVQFGYQRRDDWQTLSEFGGGQILNWGPHIIDHSLRLLGSEVKEQFGDRLHSAAGGDCEDHFSIHFIGENGRKVNMWISGACALGGTRSYCAYGNRGAVECRDGKVKVKYIDPEQDLPFVVSSRETPAKGFGSTGTFAGGEEIRWIEEEYDIDIMNEDLTVIWDYIYDTYRNGAPYPIKDEEILQMMKAADELMTGTAVRDMTAKRDSIK